MYNMVQGVCMKGDNNIIIHLNCLLRNELIAVNQYFLHSKIFGSWKLERLHNIEYQECMDELDHVDLYTRRILFLEGAIVLKRFDTLHIGKSIEDIFKLDLHLEHDSVNALKESIQYSDSIQDYVSRDIMIQILKDEEKHIDFLETELNLISKIGIHNYIQSQLKHS